MATKGKSKKSSLNEILECPLCLHQLKLPHTLQECLHTFCQTCIEAVPKKMNNGDLGWFCPMCRNFTKEDSLKQNFFINELITIYNMEENGCDLRNLICSYCPEDKDSPATFKCLDCKIELCETCEKGHRKIPILKSHTIVPLGTETEMVVDHLIFCPIHKDKQIEFNCQPCEKPLCINCKVLHHDVHKTETIKMALERLLPMINQENEKIKENEEVIRKQIREINAKIDDTKETFSTGKEQLNTKGEQIITQIKAIMKKRESQLSNRESKSVKSLEQIKQQLENKLSEIKNLTSLVTASTSKSRHVSLLNELQGGLLQRVKANAETKQKDITAQISKPQLKAVDLQSKMEELEQLLGEIQFKEENFKLNKQGEIKDESDFLCDDLVAAFSKPLKKVKEIQLQEVENGWTTCSNQQQSTGCGVGTGEEENVWTKQSIQQQSADRRAGSKEVKNVWTKHSNQQQSADRRAGSKEVKNVWTKHSNQQQSADRRAGSKEVDNGWTKRSNPQQSTGRGAGRGEVDNGWTKRSNPQQSTGRGAGRGEVDNGWTKRSNPQQSTGRGAGRGEVDNGWTKRSNQQQSTGRGAGRGGRGGSASSYRGGSGGRCDWSTVGGWRNKCPLPQTVDEMPKHEKNKSKDFSDFYFSALMDDEEIFSALMDYEEIDLLAD